MLHTKHLDKARRLDQLRVSRWYGSQGDGQSVAEAREILARLRKEAEE